MLFRSKKIEKLEKEIASLKMDLIKKENECTTYREVLRNANCSTLLSEENKKLIKWIKSILEQFGTMDVYERKRIAIPVYRKLEADYFSKEFEIQRTSVETIVIPEIVINNKIGRASCRERVSWTV